MKYQRTPIASAVAIALLGMTGVAFAADEKPAEEIQVVGIRAAKQQAINVKKKADSRVEVISAEDIGKMPDKNVADSLARVPGVTISSASGTEGGFDENDRVSMRGTSPSLTQTLLNGHNVSSGDWFVLSQSGSVGRSVSFSLLPSSLVSQVVVRKSPEASLVEGGVTGSIDIITRRPFDFKKSFTAEASVGVVYADLPGETDPQLAGLVSWQNDAKTFGILVQAFSETRSLRREGQEILGYTALGPTNSIVKAIPGLNGVLVPNLIGATLFEQERKRQGGVIDAQFKVSSDITLGFNAYTSKLEAANYNRNYMMWGERIAQNAQQIPTSYTVKDGVMTSATWPGQKGVFYGVYDLISRPDAEATSNYWVFDGKFRINDALTLKGQFGSSEGHGKTPSQDIAEFLLDGSGANYQLNGTGSGANWSFPGVNPSSSKGWGYDWSFGNGTIDIKDTDKWGQLDGEYQLAYGALSGLKFGLRYAEHEKGNEGPITNQRPGACGNTLASPCTLTGIKTAGEYFNATAPGATYGGINTFGGNAPSDVWYYTADQMKTLANNFLYRPTDGSRQYWLAEYALKEKSTAAYLQANFEGEGWSANAGVRVVKTEESITNNVPWPATAPGAITTSLFGPFIRKTTDTSFTDVLPSANLKFDLRKNLTARVAISRTLARPDFGALAGSFDLSPPGSPAEVGGGTAGNPQLKPIVSTNFDFSLEYYFAPRSLASASFFLMDLKDYVGFGSKKITSLTQFTDKNTKRDFFADAVYDVTVPVNTGATVHGVELAYEAPLFGNFGINANYTYSKGREDGGKPLNGNSKNVWNLGGYYEDDMFNARLQYTFRSAFYSGIDRSNAYTQDDVGTLSGSLGLKVNDMLSFTFDAQNLNNPTLKYYSVTESAPRAFYKNGRQYYLNARVKF